FLLACSGAHRDLHSFPTRRSSDLALGSSILHGIVLGLLVGKMLGILGVSYLAVRLRLSDLPAGLNWRHVGGIGVLGGIGFTVSQIGRASCREKCRSRWSAEEEKKK